MLRDSGIDPRAVSLLRHQTRRGGTTPHDLRQQDLARFERYQSTQQDRPVFRNARYWASFLSPSDHETLFVDLYAVEMRRNHVVDWRDDLGGAAVGAGKDVPYFFWHSELTDVLRDRIGRLRIEWGDRLRSWAQHAARNDKCIVPGTPAPTHTTEQRLSGLGFMQTHATQKITRFDRGTVTVYVKNGTGRLPIVIHPYYEGQVADLRTLPGVTLDTPFGYYINSNLSAFPRWRDTGRVTPSRYGIDLACEDDAALRALTAFLDANGTIATPDGRSSSAACIPPSAPSARLCGWRGSGRGGSGATCSRSGTGDAQSATSCCPNFCARRTFSPGNMRAIANGWTHIMACCSVPI